LQHQSEVARIAFPVQTVSRGRGAVCFDIDGTRVPGTTSGAFLADRLGHHDAVHEAERSYKAGLAAVIPPFAADTSDFREVRVTGGVASRRTAD